MADDVLSDEDKDLFRAHMCSVKPLKNQTPRVNNSTTTLPKIPQKINIAPPANKNMGNKGKQKKEYFLSDFITETVLSSTLLSYCHPNVPTKRFKALKNGQIPWEARLDLHGFKTEAARDSLKNFIQTQINNHKRCLLIIHGKGGHEGAPPVIKNLLNRWLPQFDEVLAFHSAQAKDGGHGAVYVLLKRDRTGEE